MARSRSQVADLKRLRQQQVAWLLGKSPGWLREHADIFERDADGFYNGQQAVGAVLRLKAESQVVYVDFLDVIEDAREKGLL